MTLVSVKTVRVLKEWVTRWVHQTKHRKPYLSCFQVALEFPTSSHVLCILVLSLPWASFGWWNNHFVTICLISIIFFILFSFFLFFLSFSFFLFFFFFCLLFALFLMPFSKNRLKVSSNQQGKKKKTRKRKRTRTKKRIKKRKRKGKRKRKRIKK